jgi:hypothetical protein
MDAILALFLPWPMVGSQVYQSIHIILYMWHVYYFIHCLFVLGTIENAYDHSYAIISSHDNELLNSFPWLTFPYFSLQHK